MYRELDDVTHHPLFSDVLAKLNQLHVLVVECCITNGLLRLNEQLERVHLGKG